jgi:hypothetical protein
MNFISLKIRRIPMPKVNFGYFIKKIIISNKE